MMILRDLIYLIKRIRQQEYKYIGDRIEENTYRVFQNECTFPNPYQIRPLIVFKLIFWAKFLYVFDILIFSFENDQNNSFHQN